MEISDQPSVIYVKVILFFSFKPYIFFGFSNLFQRRIAIVTKW